MLFILPATSVEGQETWILDDDGFATLPLLTYLNFQDQYLAPQRIKDSEKKHAEAKKILAQESFRMEMGRPHLHPRNNRSGKLSKRDRPISGAILKTFATF